MSVDRPGFQGQDNRPERADALSGTVFALLVLALSLGQLPVAGQSTSPDAEIVPGSFGQSPASSPSVLTATIPELQAAMEAGTLTAVDLVDVYLARIQAYDRGGARLNAILRVNPRARSEAEALDRERAEGRLRGPLHGIPVILKDNYDTFDMPTTGGSVALAGVIPPDDAFQVRKLREAGAILLAKANMHELAMGITTISSLGGQTRNPYDPRRNPGGSSGGTGAAVAAAFGAVGWGTDTCGSIRIPSCFNNLFGLRPTKGLSSIDGIIPLAHTQDVGGPLARNVTDLAIALDATIGPDPADPATRALGGRELPAFLGALHPHALEGTRLGIVTALFGNPPEDDEIAGLVREAIDLMVGAGADTVTVEIPELDDLVSPTGVINYEAKFDLVDYFAQTPNAPVDSLQQIVERGLFHMALEDRYQRRDRVETRNSEEYLEALSRRDTLAAALLRVMDEYRLDGLVYPSVRTRPNIIGEGQTGSNCQVSAGSGFPAMAIPAGFTDDGLPAGLELLGRPWDDGHLVAMAYAYEQVAHPWRPPDSAPALVEGKAPAPIDFEAEVRGGSAEAFLRGRFTFDRVTGELAYHLSISDVPEQEAFAVTLQRGAPQDPGPVLHRLMGPGKLREDGVLRLSYHDRKDLEGGRLLLAWYSASEPGGRFSPLIQVPGR